MELDLKKRVITNSRQVKVHKLNCSVTDIVLQNCADLYKLIVMSHNQQTLADAERKTFIQKFSKPLA